MYKFIKDKRGEINTILVIVLVGVISLIGIMWLTKTGPFEPEGNVGIDLTLISEDGRELSIIPGRTYSFTINPLGQLEDVTGYVFSKVRIQPWAKPEGNAVEYGGAVTLNTTLAYVTEIGGGTNTGSWQQTWTGKMGHKNYGTTRELNLYDIVSRLNPSTGLGFTNFSFSGTGQAGSATDDFSVTTRLDFGWKNNTLTITAGTDTAVFNMIRLE